jgi:hypothetical protein
VGLTTPHGKKLSCYENSQEASEMDLGEIGWDGRDWIELAQDRDQWRALVNTVMNLWVP